MSKGDLKRLGDYIREEEPGFGGDETIGCQHLQRIHAVHSKYHRNGYVFL